MAKLDKLISEHPNRILESLGKGNNTPKETSVLAFPTKKMQGREPLDDFFLVRLDRIIPDPNQPRKTFDKVALEQLAQSIKETGLENPIAIRWCDELETNVIVHGERRYRACKMAGLKSIRCQLSKQSLSPDEVLSRQIVENIHRQDLLPSEEAQAYRKLMQLKAWTAKQLSTHLGWPQSTVSNTLAVLKLPEDIQKLVDSGQLAISVVPELAKLKKTSTQRNLVEKILAEGLRYKEVQLAVRQRQGKATPKRRVLPETYHAASGVRVTISASSETTEAEKTDALKDALAIRNPIAAQEGKSKHAIADYSLVQTDLGPQLIYALANGVKLSLSTTFQTDAVDLEASLRMVLDDVQVRSRQLADSETPIASSSVWT